MNILMIISAFYRDANDNNLLDPQDQLLGRVDFGGDFGGLGYYGAIDFSLDQYFLATLTRVDRALPSYYIMPSEGSVSENSALDITVYSAGDEPGTRLYWALSGDIDSDDFSFDELTGSGDIDSSGVFF